MKNDQQTGGQTTTQAFMAALQQAEATGDVTLRNLTQQTWEGEAGARAFWETYLGNFEKIRSEFTRSHEADGLGVMEWTASGRLRGGHPVEYRGVSLIELSGGQVAAFRTYYDSAAFVVAPA